MPTTELLLQDEYDFPDEKELEQIEYLELESLIITVVERLDAEWTFDAEEEVYLIEVSDEVNEEVTSESVSVYTTVCGEGYNEGRDLLICEIELGQFNEEEDSAIELLTLSDQLIHSRISMTENQLVVLSSSILAHGADLDLLTAMVEEIAAFANIFRQELEGH